MLTVEVPSLGSPEVRVSNPAQGTVDAMVMAVDVRTNQVRVRTQEGQTLVLNLSPDAVMGMRVGDQFTLVIAQRSMQ
jgi:arginine repressor